MKREDKTLVHAFMQSLAAAAEPGGRPLPEAQLIVRRAEVRARLEAEERLVLRAAVPLVAAAVLGPFALMAVLWDAPAAGLLMGVLGAAATALSGMLALRLAMID